MKKIFCSLALLATSFGVSAGYTVDAEVFSNTQLIGKPRLLVEANEKGRVVMDGIYDLSLTVNPQSDKTISLDTTIKLAGQQLKPTFHANLGEKMMVESDNHKFIFVVSKTQD